MSREQAETLKVITGSIMKTLLGISGAVLSILYYHSVDTQKEFRRQVDSDLQQIKETVISVEKSTEAIKSDLNLYKYRIEKLEEK
jgi:hypothetical protein